MFDAVPDSKKRCRVLYVSPLKALAVDVERNLRAPLVGIARQAESLGVPVHIPEVAIRTGDTPSKERAHFQRHPSDILITTPESLYLLLTSQARDALRSVRWVIIDEIHALVGTKRGAHMSLCLERLQEITGGYQRVGLSATQRPLDEVARFLGGYESVVRESVPEANPVEFIDLGEDEEGVTPAPIFNAVERPVQIVDAGSGKVFDIQVAVPVEDMARLGEIQEIPSGPASQGEVRTSIWPAIHPMILELIRTHRSTLIFVNSRRLAERLANALNELAGEEIVHAHHGSIAREKRQQIEDELKSGLLPAMVATSSLELGIDMGAIDLVIQVEAPPSVSSAIQRIGRAGHQVGAPSQGIIIPKFRGDLLACAALAERMVAGAVEPMRYPRNPLDVLAQQIVAMVSMDDWTIDTLEAVLRRSANYAELPRSMYLEVLDMLSGRYPADDFAELRPRITWDRITGNLTARQGAKRIAIANGGTIPDRGLYGVFLVDAGGEGGGKGKGRVGELDEEMVHETRVGEIFLLGASSWRVEEITHDRVLVSPAPGEPGKMPFWHGDRPGRPLEFGKAIGTLTRTLLAQDDTAATKQLIDKHALNELAARNLLQYLKDQVEATGSAPDDKTIVIESYQDEMGDWRVCLLCPFGSRVLGPWALALTSQLRDSSDYDLDVLWTDDGIVIRFPESDEPPNIELLFPDPDEVEDLVIRQLGSGGSARQDGTGAPPVAMFASRFREAAARALLLPRKNPSKRAPLWQQRKRASELLQVASKFGSFPIVLETYRECLRDIFDMPALTQLLRDIRSRQIRVVPVTSRIPSPFAGSLLFNYVANFIYEGDSPIAERRAQALTVDPTQLRELLGDIELRDLLDLACIEEVEAGLQHTLEDRHARHPDRVHDLLLRLGALSLEELRARSGPEIEAWAQQLLKERRIIALIVAGETRFAAAEDAGRYRDALGIPPPQGLPIAFLELVDDPLGDLVSQYVRTHGPFQTEDIAKRLGIGVGPVNTIIRRMVSTGRVMEGQFRPGGAGKEWCEVNVLRSIRQKSLARLRREVEPVDQPALGRLVLAWQHVIEPRRGRNALFETIEQLQGLSIPASVLETSILPARLPDYDRRELDMLCSSGAILWVGRESLGQHDGRISLYLSDAAPYLIEKPSDDVPSGKMHGLIRDFLAGRGASFFPQIMMATGGFPPEVLEALWDLVWSGEVTNDTLQPLRAYVTPTKTSRTPEARMRGATISRYRQSIRGPSVAPGRAVDPSAIGRWSLVSNLIYGTASTTERITARARLFLDRYGVVTREAIQSEGLEGGFSAVYGVLKAMEESGAVRRGYFVAGLGATQFSENSALDRLRSLRDPPDVPQTLILSAVDPANSYGSALDWPEHEGSRRPMRQAGAQVVLMDGSVIAWLPKSERQIVTFLESVPERSPEEAADELARALSRLVTSGQRRAVFIEEVDGLSPDQTKLSGPLLESGFKATSKGYLKRL
jgi:ATP-dependent Lhr-like helicase